MISVFLDRQILALAQLLGKRRWEISRRYLKMRSEHYYFFIRESKSLGAQRYVYPFILGAHRRCKGYRAIDCDSGWHGHPFNSRRRNYKRTFYRDARLRSSDWWEYNAKTRRISRILTWTCYLGFGQLTMINIPAGDAGVSAILNLLGFTLNIWLRL